MVNPEEAVIVNTLVRRARFGPGSDGQERAECGFTQCGLRAFC